MSDSQLPVLFSLCVSLSIRETFDKSSKSHDLRKLPCPQFSRNIFDAYFENILKISVCQGAANEIKIRIFKFLQSFLQH